MATLESSSVLKIDNSKEININPSFSKFSNKLVSENLEILEIYFRKTDDEIKDEYMMLYNSGSIQTVDCDLKLLVILYSLYVCPDIFSDYEISLMKMIVMMRNSSIGVTFNIMYPIVKCTFPNIHSLNNLDLYLKINEQRIRNLEEMKPMISQILYSSRKISCSPVSKNYIKLEYGSPVKSDVDTLSTLSDDFYESLYDCSDETVYCEFNC